MSTNPFRQTRVQPDVQGTVSQQTELRGLSDGSGSRATDRNDFSLHIDVNNNSYERHVSFASPPVDSTHPAASYPSSPESIRSPPNYFARTGALATPDYRTAIHSDPFEDLVRDKQEDGTLQQAVSNAQSNISVGQPASQREQPQDSAVWDTLSRFASAPSRPPVPDAPARPPIQDSRKSLDVDAFKRLLLTGNTNTTSESGQQSIRRPAPPPPRNNVSNTIATQPAPETSFGLPSPGSSESAELNAKKSSFIDSLVQSGEKFSTDSAGKLPPPAPAPRRAKPVKTGDQSPLPSPLPTSPDDESTKLKEETAPGQGKSSRKPPAPPIARRQSQRIPSNKSDESIATPSPTPAPAELARPGLKAPPPPPPIRRQSSTTVRRPSQELTPTIEEPEPDVAPTLGSRRSSANPPSQVGSRNPSVSRVPNPGLMSPPALPPPRKGRGSSRSSMDSFRPSLSTLMGDNDAQENESNPTASRPVGEKDRSSLTASNANSILAELANLQKEVDAARRT